MPNSWLLPTAAFGLAAACGWFAGSGDLTKDSSSPSPASVPPDALAGTGTPAAATAQVATAAPVQGGADFLKWIDSLEAPDFAGELARRATLPPGPLSALEEHLILTRWAQLDPAACVHWMSTQGRTASMETALRLWAQKDPGAAWQAMGNLSLKEQEKTACLKGLCQAILEQDPDLFLRLPAQSLSQTQAWRNARHTALVRLAATRPELALEHIQSAANFEKFDLTSVAGVRAQTHPEAALAWSQNCGWEAEKRDLFQRAAVAKWAEKDPEAAARVLLSLPSLMHSESTEEPDPRAAVTARLAAVDMRQSMAWLMENVPATEQTAFVKTLRRVLPDDLTRWLPDFFASVPEGPQRGALLKELLSGERGYPRFTGLEILKNLQQMPASPDWLPVIRTVAAEYTGGPAFNVMSTAEQLPSLQGPVRAAVALQLAQRAPGVVDPSLLVPALTEDPGFLSAGDISGLLKSSLPTGLAVLEKLGYRENCYSEAARLQAAKDAPGTAEWVNSLSDERARQEAAAGLITAWCGTDEYAASEWAAALPSGAMRDEAAASLASHLASSSPADAWAWMMSVRDAATRSALLEKIADSWLKSDASAARAAISGAPLPAALREGLLSQKSSP